MASATKKLKTRTTITQHDEQEVSIRSLDVLPEMLQVRAKLDKGWSLEYSKGYARGDAFPPILIYLLPNGRLVVTDGFHRVDACLALGLETIRAQIREGTLHEALIAAIEANTAAYHRGRPFGDDDRVRAAELMFADPECWGWSDSIIAKRCGISPISARRHRNAYALRNGIALPVKVLGESGRIVRYRRSGVPAVLVVRNASGSSSYRTYQGGRLKYLGTDREAAQEKLDAILAEMTERRRSLDLASFGVFLDTHRLSFASVKFGTAAFPYVRGRYGHGAVIVTVKLDAEETVPWAVGCLMMLRILSGDPSARMIAVCFKEDGPMASIDLARKLGIEFLSPEELYASLTQKT